MLKVGDEVIINIKEKFGIMPVSFKVISVINKDYSIYGLIVDNKIVVGERSAGGYWNLSEVIWACF